VSLSVPGGHGLALRGALVDVVRADRLAPGEEVERESAGQRQQCHDKVEASQVASPPTTAADGSVMTHAMTILPTTPQWTSASFLPSPDPMTDPLVTCVVDSAKPRCEETRIVAAELVSAAKPCGDCTSEIFLPTVCMMRQPPM